MYSKTCCVLDCNHIDAFLNLLKNIPPTNAFQEMFMISEVTFLMYCIYVFLIVNATNGLSDFLKRSHELCEAIQVLLILMPDSRTYRANSHFGERIKNEMKRIFNSSVYERKTDKVISCVLWIYKIILWAWRSWYNFYL